ncbi:hypothetical protein K445DRAFT_11077 [Daldinia sp. EC12]|nr:hypothetical protein K445DRAFT_11077 [Daldinia sp. EC12]
MPVLTRKRKAELEAAAKEAPIQARPEADQPAQEPSPKRHKRTDPFERTDPFRPHSPPLKTIICRRSPSVKLKQPLPVVFFTIPTTNSSNQVSAKGRSSNDVDTIMVTKSLFEHVDKYGVSALPTKEVFDAWLEENKETFIQSRKERDHQQVTLAQLPQDLPRATAPLEVILELPAPQNNHQPNLAAGPPPRHRRVVPVANQRIIYRAVRAARHTAAQFLNRAALIFEDPAADLGVIHGEEQQIRQQPRHTDTGAISGTDKKENTDVKEKKTNTVETEPEPMRVRPVAPPLDVRFFHPNGQLQSLYRYLTAQIPLPRQWVRWAINNGINEVPGRGDIRDSGIYVADDTFDYDALFEAVHRGSFRTGRSEIDGYGEYWPMVRGHRDSTTVDLTLHHLSVCLSPYQRTELNKQKEQQPNMPPPETASIPETGTSPALHDEES